MNYLYTFVYVMSSIRQTYVYVVVSSDTMCLLYAMVYRVRLWFLYSWSAKFDILPFFDDKPLDIYFVYMRPGLGTVLTISLIRCHKLWVCIYLQVFFLVIPKELLLGAGHLKRWIISFSTFSLNFSDASLLGGNVIKARTLIIRCSCPLWSGAEKCFPTASVSCCLKRVDSSLRCFV